MMTSTDRPQILRIQRRTGIAGQYSIVATVQYPEEPASSVEFVGSTFGGPVVMVTELGQVFVTEPERFGKFGESWVRRFFGEED